MEEIYRSVGKAGTHFLCYPYTMECGTQAGLNRPIIFQQSVKHTNKKRHQLTTQQGVQLRHG
jgi:hypothetical protein